MQGSEALSRHPRRLQINKWASLLVLVLGFYLEAVEWLDLYPWTTSFAVTHGDNGQQSLDIVMAFILIAMAAALWHGGRIVSLICAALLSVWMWLQISTWWIPYMQGASVEWQRVYAKWFAGTVQFLPARPGHLPPDANHFVLQLILAASIVACIASAMKRKTMAG